MQKERLYFGKICIEYRILHASTVHGQRSKVEIGKNRSPPFFEFEPGMRAVLRMAITAESLIELRLRLAY